MQLHEEMALSSAYPRISRIPFERGLIALMNPALLTATKTKKTLN